MSNFYAHQSRFLQENPPKKLLCWDTGTGKTIAAIHWAKQQYGTAVLVICPKALRKNWERHIKKEDPNPFNPWKVMTKEEFRKDWSNISKYDIIIVDEAHYFAGMKSQMTKALRSYIVQYRIQSLLLLTATPYMSTPWNIYVLAKHLGYDWSYISFKFKFFQDRYIGKRVVPEVRPGMEGEIAALVAKIGDVVRLDECVDVPQQVFDVESFELTKAQERAKKTITEPNPVVRFTKMHQIENGSLKGDGYSEDETFDSNKTERIKELCEEHKKVIIVCRYKLQMRMLEHELLELGKPIYVIDGEVSGDLRDKMVQEADAIPEAIVIVNAACSEGYELPSFPLMVFASLSFSYKDYKQMIGRILRINKLKKNLYLHLVTNGVDAAVYDAIMKKQDFDIEIYARQHEGKGFSDELYQISEGTA